MMFTFKLDKPLEQNIQSYLTEFRKLDPTQYRFTMFLLFTSLNCARTQAIILRHRRTTGQRTLPAPVSGIPVAVFNKTIGDMKRVGIVGTCKGGEEVFLSNAAWEHYLKEEAYRAPVSTATEVTEGGK